MSFWRDTVLTSLDFMWKCLKSLVAPLSKHHHVPEYTRRCVTPLCFIMIDSRGPWVPSFMFQSTRKSGTNLTSSCLGHRKLLMRRLCERFGTPDSLLTKVSRLKHVILYRLFYTLITEVNVFTVSALSIIQWNELIFTVWEERTGVVISP
jgi:hypothetical protein